MAFVQHAVQTGADESERLYRLIAESIPQIIWTARADGWVDYVNRRFYEYTGLKSPAPEGWGWKEVIHPADLEQCAAVWTRALQSGARYEAEFRMRRADGIYRWHHGSAVVMRDSDGRHVRWFGVCTDVEAEIRSTQMLERMVEERTRALRESESRFRSLTGLSSDWYWEQDSEFRITLISQAFGERTGLDAADFTGRRSWEQPALNLTEADWAQHRVTLESHRSFHDFEIQRPLGEGHSAWLSLSGEPVFDADGVFRGYRGVGRDITERKRSEQALRESQQRFQRFMEHLPIAAWIRDSHLRFTFANDHFQQEFGFRLDQLQGREAARLFPEALAEQFRNSDLRVQRNGGPLQFYEDAPSADGRVRRWLKIKFPLADADGGTGVAGLAIDVTQRMQAEEKARRYASEARRLMQQMVSVQEAERRRIAGELHDLIGQNLTALGIDLSALNASLPDARTAGIAARVDAMAQLLDSTIDAIRGVMTELRPPALEEYGLVPTLRWYATVFGERTGMKCSVSVLGRELRLPRDTELTLFRIVQEALTNAAKHSGGTAVHITMAESEGRLRLSVEDDGCGFANAAGARSARRGGWGLPTMRERAETHGGVLRLEFPERGTRVVVEIPGTDAD